MLSIWSFLQMLTTSITSSRDACVAVDDHGPPAFPDTKSS
jgi:hypothetical protein